MRSRLGITLTIPSAALVAAALLGGAGAAQATTHWRLQPPSAMSTDVPAPATSAPKIETIHVADGAVWG